MEDVLRKIALEAARRSLSKLRLEPSEIKREPVAKPSLSPCESHQVNFTVEFDSTGMISEPDVTVDVDVDKLGEPHAVSTCITHYRAGGQLEHRYPHTWGHFWIYEHEVSS